MADPHAKDVVRLRPNAAVSDRELEAPVQQNQTYSSGSLLDGGAVLATPLMEPSSTHPHDGKVEEASATRARPLQKRALNQSTTTPHDREAEEAATTKAPVARPSQKRALDQSTTTPGNNRRKRGLPMYWCDWCLSRHVDRSDHVRAPTENQAMHDAIASGAMPKVDPWGAIQAARAPRPTIEPPKPLIRDSLATFEPSEEAMAHIESGDPERMTKYIALLRANDEKIRAHKAAEAARVAVEAAITATAANLPTGPPSKKRRRGLAARDDRQQPNNNRRPRKLPRVANSALTTSESSNTPPNL